MSMPDSIAGYRVRSLFRAGSMAELYEAQSPEGESCLIKRPRQGFTNHPACYAGFETEQMIYRHLTGPHVPRCHASGEDEAGPYLILEHVHGVSLEEIAAAAPLPVEEVTSLGARLASALHALHRQNVVHHDLTPRHVILSPDATGRAVLIDFGLACHGDLPDLVASEAGGAGGVLGTPAIIAPEQLLGVRGDPRSDIYSAGAILYRLATGRYPFGMSTAGWGLHRRRWFDPVPPSRLRPGLPVWFEEIILRCLAVRPERRYASAAQLAHDLMHPEQIEIVRSASPGDLWSLAWQRWRAERSLAHSRPQRPLSQLERAPHVLVAVDTDDQNAALAEGMRLAVRRLIARDPHWRITCLSVLSPSLLSEQEEAAELQRSFHTARLAALHQWARPLGLPAGRVRFHVVTGRDAASGILDYARTLHVDHIVIGARGSSGLRRLLGSVSARVAAEAPCSVTVVRG